MRPPLRRARKKASEPQPDDWIWGPSFSRHERISRAMLDDNRLPQRLEIAGFSHCCGVHRAKEDVSYPEQRLVATTEMANANPSLEALALQRHYVRTVRSVLLVGPVLEREVVDLHTDHLVIQGL